MTTRPPSSRRAPRPRTVRGGNRIELRSAPTLVSVLALAVAAIGGLLAGWGCAGRRAPGSDVDAGLTQRIAAVVVADLESTGSSRPVTVTTEDRLGRAGPWLRDLARSVALALRARGIAAYPGPPVLGSGAITITAMPGGDWLSVGRAGPAAETARARVRMPAGFDTPPAMPPFHSREWTFVSVTGWSTLALFDPGERPLSGVIADAARRLRAGARGGAAGPSTFLALSPDSIRALRIVIRDGVPALTPEGAAPTPVDLIGASTDRVAAPGDLAPREGVPQRRLVELGRTDGTFVALDGAGVVRHGNRLGLWGTPVAGHGAGLAPMDGGVVTALDARAGENDALVHLVIDASRRLVERERLDTGPDLVRGLAAVDVDQDGLIDLVVAQDHDGGTRLSVFLSGGKHR